MQRGTKSVTCEDDLLITVDGNGVCRAVTCLISPIEGLKRQGLIRSASVVKGQQGKHVLYMMAQRALIDFEEGALELVFLEAGRSLECPIDGRAVSISQGAILSVDRENRIRLYIHREVPVRKMLVAFHRMATRMIRLDVP